MASQYAMMNSAAAVRAIGSAEASKVTLRDRVSVYQQFTERSTPERPDFSIEYKYNITGVELGLRSSLGILHSVQGKCYTEYGWIDHSEPGRDYYIPWGSSQLAMSVPSDGSPCAVNSLGLFAALYPPHVEEITYNVSYALLYITAHLPTTTESDDAMYKTEKMPDGDGWDELYPFRVKAGRPVLSCWQSSTVRVKGQWFDPLGLANNTEVPAAIRMILVQLGTPALLSIT